MSEARGVSHELCDRTVERTEARLAKHGETLDELKDCTVRLTQIAEAHNEKLHDYGARLSHLERRPTHLMERIGTALLSALSAALVSLLLG